MASALKVAPSRRPARDVHLVLWCFVFLMHIAACGFAFTMAYAHQYLQHVTGGYNYVRVLKLLQPVTVTVAVYATIAIFHGLQLVRMCIWLVRPPIPTAKHSSCGGPIVRAMRRTLRLFSSRGPYYELKLAIKHVILAASQTYRAYATSVLVDVSMINLTFSVVLFAYGVLLPLLWRFASPVARRQYTIAAAVCINFTANVILPTWILRPYYTFFTRPDSSKIVYQDTFYPIGVSVCQSVLATSYLDLTVAAITHAFLLFALADFMTTFVLVPKVLLQRASTLRDRKLPRWCSFSAVVGYITSIFWAIAVLVISFASLRQPSCEPGCLAQTYPWLTGKCACTVLETTCDGVNGMLLLPPTDSLEVRSLVFLIISHCPHLVMPSSLQAFTNLIGLEIFNSTLLSWDATVNIAPLTRFSYAQMVRTNMTDLPLGLFVDAPSTSRSTRTS
ncbi:hypothetical protein SDRG_07320 [Saprolegnia diclina VS20]|uniref:Uncharacterized protein n=1 Tax=Saprolegnia diclina (strain VS20) TaxID=1156394 RepID=T0QB27_SAPDV|nr:hypothetical protein SDRG_07320 [Saprolegnia diclina VS20]EQC35084.1 hypothetical protein SDRG_07320 [Saprolegnia diclina VS20]|eukprot:XP_008611368.1 hypothetical protein SDRG_07320 [Saprolegnia diclina VS20]